MADNRDARGKKPRYQGYNLDQTKVVKNKSWFWQVLGLSLIITLLVIGVFMLLFFKRTQKVTKYVKKINAANTMELMLKNHENVRIIQSYSHLADDGDDYKETRQVEYLRDNNEQIVEDGGYYCYYKIEGTENDYKEVIKNKRLYRSDDNFATFYGLLDNEYEDILVPQIEGDVIQIDTNDTIEDQHESEDIIKLKLTHTVQTGDTYNKKYGFDAGTVIDKTVTLNKKSNLITSEVESVNDEEFYSYLVEYDVERKVPNFYQKMQATRNKRNATVYFDYKGDDPKTYTYTFRNDVYFDLLEHEGYKVYLDKACTSEFTEYQKQVQNPVADIVLYVVKESK